MKKRVLAVVLVLVMVAGMFVGCAKQDAEWSIEIVGGKTDAFTSVDYEKLDEVEITAVMKKKTGTEVTQVWQGVKFADLVDAIGAVDYISITVEAADGYAQEYTSDIVNDDMTILGTVVDGEALGANQNWVQTVAGKYPGNMWIRDIVKIIINK